MQQAEGLEGTQELPLDESPTDGKDFLEAAGYVRIKACVYIYIYITNKKTHLIFSVLHVKLPVCISDGRTVALTNYILSLILKNVVSWSQPLSSSI